MAFSGDSSTTPVSQPGSDNLEKQHNVGLITPFTFTKTELTMKTEKQYHTLQQYTALWGTLSN